MAHKHKYGWRPSLPDHRDIMFGSDAHLAGAVELASEIDPRDSLPLVYDQGQLGSCTGNAVAAAIQYDFYLDGKFPLRSHRPSRLDIYYGERSLEGTLMNGDCGAVGRDGFKYAQQTGVMLERDWPYVISQFQTPPPSGPRPYKLTKQYASVPMDVTLIKTALNKQQTIAFGFTVYESFESGQVASNGIVPMPTPGEQVLGGHEVLIVGYLSAYPNHALVRNSWGANWGIGGYFLMPWSYITNSNLAGDLRTIVRV